MSNQLATFNVGDWTVLGRTVFKPPFKISDSLVNEARIVHVVKGYSKLYSAQQMIELKPDDTLIMKSDNFVNHWQANDDDSLNKVIVFQLNADFLRQLYEQNIPSWFTPTDESSRASIQNTDPNPPIQAYFAGLNSYIDDPQYLKEDVLKLKVKEIISLLVETDKSGNAGRLFGDLFLDREYDFQQVIRKNLFEDLNLDDLAHLTGLSLSSFKRKFSSLFGTSPNKYITSKRLERAQMLLLTTEQRVSDIAYDCGFSDVGYFSKLFRSIYEASPSEFREQAES